MKRTLYVVAAALLFASLMVTCAGALQSLGEVARQQRESKRPSAAKVYTNDDIAPSPQASAPAAPAAKTDQPEEVAPPKAEDKAKLAADLTSKIDEQKKAVAQLERELDVAQREYRLKVAVYYADAGNSLRDSKKWAEEDRKQKAELEGKQKAVAEAKQKLADLQEQARKSGTRAE